MKLASKKSAPKKSPFVAINKTELRQLKGGAKHLSVKKKNEVD